MDALLNVDRFNISYLPFRKMTRAKISRKSRFRNGNHKLGYSLLGLLLIPLCVAAARTLWHMISSGTRPFQDAANSTSALFFCGGMLLWLFVYGILPRPVKIYVLGHELTHAFCAWLSGGTARRLRIGSRGGSVAVTASNFFVVLSPYFIPLYAVLVLAAYFVCSLFFDQHPVHAWWMAGLGVSWGFHLTFTGSALSLPQKDLEVYGPLFSYAVIVFFNLLFLVAGVVWIGSPAFEEVLVVFAAEVRTVARWPLMVWMWFIRRFAD